MKENIKISFKNYKIYKHDNNNNDMIVEINVNGDIFLNGYPHILIFKKYRHYNY